MKSYLLMELYCNLIVALYGAPTDEQFQQVLRRLNQLEHLTEKQNVEITELHDLNQVSMFSYLYGQRNKPAGKACIQETNYLVSEPCMLTTEPTGLLCESSLMCREWTTVASFCTDSVLFSDVRKPTVISKNV